jgi:hypothetical protein
VGELAASKRRNKTGLHNCLESIFVQAGAGLFPPIRLKYGGNMFCPSCGAEATPGLKYCKRCGGNLGDAVHIAAQASDSSSSKYTGAALIIGLTSVAISLGGIGIVFSQAMELVGPHFPGPRVGDATMVAMTMIIFGSATVFGIMALLIRLFTRLLTAPSEPARRRSRACL